MTAAYAIAAFAIVIAASTAYGGSEELGRPESARPFIMASYLATQAPVASAAPVDGLTVAHLRSGLAKLDAERPQIWQASVAPDASAWDRK